MEDGVIKIKPKSVKKYKCPYCEARYERTKLVSHIDKKHEDMIPQDYTSTRIVFNLINKKTKGSCIICGEETSWNENKARYERICDKPACMKKYKEMTADRLYKKYGKTKEDFLKDPEFQEKMLQNRKISGKYKFSDGGIMPYVGSYEKNFLEFMDVFFHVSSTDLIAPGPIIDYTYKGEKHKWITDFYYAPYNLVFDVKDGGDNPNNREMTDYRAKQIAKESAISKLGEYNYIRLTNNQFEQMILLMMELKETMEEEPMKIGGKRVVIRINESISSKNIKNDISTINEGILNIGYKYLYHGSIGKYDLLQPYGVDLGNAFQKPGFSLYTFVNKEDAKGWAIFDIVKKILKNNNIGKANGCIWSKQVILLRDTYNKLINIIPKLSVFEKTYYVYTIKVQNDFKLGFGHSSNTKNCVTIRNKDIKPYYLDKYILTIEDLNDNCFIIESEDQYSKKEFDKLKGMNGRFLTPFMVNDAMYNWEAYRQIKKAIRNGEIEYNDESLNNYIKNNNIEIYHPSIKDRLFIESAVIDPNHKTKKTNIKFKFIDIETPNIDKYLKQDSYCRKYLDYIHSHNIGEIVIDENKDKIAGYIFINNKNYTGFIMPLEVIKEYRGYGLSNKLLDDAINNYGSVDLCVDKDNEVAIRLYKKHGFVIIGDGESKKQYWMKLKTKLTAEEREMIVNESYILNKKC